MTVAPLFVDDVVDGEAEGASPELLKPVTLDSRYCVPGSATGAEVVVEFPVVVVLEGTTGGAVTPKFSGVLENRSPAGEATVWPTGLNIEPSGRVMA